MLFRNAGKTGPVFKPFAGLKAAFILLGMAGAGGGWLTHSASASTLRIPLASVSHIEKISATYHCNGPKDLLDKLGQPTVSVTYLNAGAVSLAVLKVEGQTQVFSNVIAASGARYTANRFEWWDKGDTAFFAAVGEESAPRLTCQSIPKAAARKHR